MIKIIREDCQYFIEQMNKLLENEDKGELHIVQEGGEDARKDINEIFSTWGRNEIYACTLSNQSSYQFDSYDFKNKVRKAFIAKLGDNPVGFVFIERYSGGANATIGVKSGDEFRNKGIASKLAAHLLDWFESKSNDEFDHLYWGNLNTNVASSRIADKFDFEPYDTQMTNNFGETVDIRVHHKKTPDQIPLQYVKGATILSEDEVEELVPDNCRAAKLHGEPFSWWLRDDHNSKEFGYVVNKKGDISTEVAWSSCGVRPALIINARDAELKNGQQFSFGANVFIVISDKMAISTRCINSYCFSPEGGSYSQGYEKSGVKDYVDKWFKYTVDKIKNKKQEE